MSVTETSTSRWATRLVEALVSSRAISEEAGRRVTAAAGEGGLHVALALEQEGVADVPAAMGWLSAVSGLVLVDLAEQPPDPEAMAKVPEAMARRYGVLGYRLQGRRLVLVCAEPPDAETIRVVAGAIKEQVEECVLADPRAIQAIFDAARAQVARRTVGAPAPAAAPAPPNVHAAAARRLSVLGSQPPEPARPEPGSWRGSSGRPASRPDELPDPDLDDLLVRAVQAGASDLHLTDRFPPAMRVDGAIRPMKDLPRLQGEQIRRMMFGVIPQSLRERFEETKELDTSYALPGVGRFRVNVFQQRGAVGAVLRAIPDEIPPLESLALPPAVTGLAELRKGLVLVTGPTGSGKSTTLAAVIEVINQTKPFHIVTVEEPIEFLHGHGRSIVNQREVGQDTKSFSHSLRHVLRQDPDVIMVGELRDLETISMAITAAETGHLVFATLHTQDAPQSVDRMIDVFPTSQQEQVRIQLAGALEAIVTQQLVLSASGSGRVAVAEVMVCTAGIRNLIRSAKSHQIYSLMQTGGATGMQTMDQALAQAVAEGRITEQMAIECSRDPGQLLDYLRGPNRLRGAAR